MSAARVQDPRESGIERLELLAYAGLTTPGARAVLEALRSGDEAAIAAATDQAQREPIRYSEWERDLPLFCTAACAATWADPERARSEAISALRFQRRGGAS